MQLSEIDQSFEEHPGFRIVQEMTFHESGVDPIGMRQLNLMLMDAAVPGINNVTRHVRPYTFMAWAWWKAHGFAEAQELGLEEVGDLIERYEALYAWSHLIAGKPFRGASAVQRWIAGRSVDDPFHFDGESWKQYKAQRTSFMAPTEYGPSIKALRYLVPASGQIADETMEAVVDFDTQVTKAVPKRLLEPVAPLVFAEEVASFAHILPIDEPSQVEMKVFKYLFYGIGASEGANMQMQRRKATLDLLVGTLREMGPSNLDSIRRKLAVQSVPVALVGNKEVAASAMLLCHLQIRQLQRLATEAMLLWLERLLSEEGRYGRARSSEEIMDRADGAASSCDGDYEAAQTVGAFLDAVSGSKHEKPWPASAADAETDVIGLMGQLIAAQRKDITLVPALAARAFAVTRAMTLCYSGVQFPSGVVSAIVDQPDRLPLGTLVNRLNAIFDRPRKSLWREVIESWVIGQHVHWSAVRGGDGKKRLRVGMEGDGWRMVRRPFSGYFVPTADRLDTLLSLGTSCGMFVRESSDSFAVVE